MGNFEFFLIIILLMSDNQKEFDHEARGRNLFNPYYYPYPYIFFPPHQPRSMNEGLYDYQHSAKKENFNDQIKNPVLQGLIKTQIKEQLVKSEGNMNQVKSEQKMGKNLIILDEESKDWKKPKKKSSTSATIMKILKNRAQKEKMINSKQIVQEIDFSKIVSQEQKRWVYFVFNYPPLTVQQEEYVRGNISKMDSYYIQMIKVIIQKGKAYYRERTHPTNLVIKKAIVFYHKETGVKKIPKFINFGGYGAATHQYMKQIFAYPLFKKQFVEYAPFFLEEIEEQSKAKVEKVIQILKTNRTQILPDLVSRYLVQKMNPSSVKVRKRIVNRYLDILYRYTEYRPQVVEIMEKYIQNLDKSSQF